MKYNEDSRFGIENFSLNYINDDGCYFKSLTKVMNYILNNEIDKTDYVIFTNLVLHNKTEMQVAIELGISQSTISRRFNTTKEYLRKRLEFTSYVIRIYINERDN